MNYQKMNQDSSYLASLNVEDKKIKYAEIRYDLKFEIHHPLDEKHPGFLIDIEAQQESSSLGYNLKDRGLYYASRLISGQKNDPEGFQKMNFNQMKSVKSIWICMNHVLEKDGQIERFQILHKKTDIDTGKVLRETYDDREEIIIVNPKMHPTDVKTKASLSNLFNVLFRPKILTKEERIEILEEKYDIIITDKFREEMEVMCNLSEGILQQGIEEGLAQGIKQGLSQGLSQGIEVGKLDSTVQHVKSLMEELPDLDVYKAMDLLKVEEGLRDKVVRAIQ